jgi:peptide/nickel transport system substrate-binding protein
MYEPLEVVNPLDGKLTPFLATGHSQPDAQTLVFTIRDGVTWSDGTPFSAKDVQFTFELLQKNPTLDLLGVWQHISTLEVDGNIVTIRLQEGDVPAVGVIARQLIVPEHIWADVKDPVDFKNENPVASGPFTLDTFSPNQYTLVKNKDYWQADRVQVEKIVQPASNTALDITTKGYDWAYKFISDIDKTWVKADKQHNTYWFPPGGTIALYPNLTKAPFDNQDMRTGLSLALDREKIANDAGQGYVKAAGQSGLILPNQKEWLDPALPNGGEVKQDTAKALESFAKAGYTQKNGKLVDASGTQLSLTITTANGWTDWLQGVQAIKAQLEKLGIAVSINQPQPAAYEQARSKGDFDLIMGSFGGTGSAFQDFNNLLNSSFATPVGTQTQANFQRFSDPEVDALLAQLKTTIDEGEQKKIVAQLEHVVYDRTPVVSLFYGGLWGMFSTKNFTGWPSEKDPYAPPMTWDSSPLLIFTNLTKAGQ